MENILPNRSTVKAVTSILRNNLDLIPFRGMNGTVEAPKIMKRQEIRG